MHNSTCDVMFLYRKLLLILSGLCEGKHSYKATLASKSLERSQPLWVPGLWLSHPQNTKKFLRSKYHYKPLERHLDSQCFYLSGSVTREPWRKGLCCVFFSILFYSLHELYWYVDHCSCLLLWWNDPAWYAVGCFVERQK